MSAKGKEKVKHSVRKQTNKQTNLFFYLLKKCSMKGVIKGLGNKNDVPKRWQCNVLILELLLEEIGSSKVPGKKNFTDTHVGGVLSNNSKIY